MKKRFFSILICFCMVLGLLPATALATDGPDFSTLGEGEKITIDDTEYTYQGDASDSGIEMTTVNLMSQMALKEACCWKAGDGYVLYNPTVGSVDWYGVDVTTSAEVTLHNAEITFGVTVLRLPYNSPSATAYPVDVTVKVEGENRLTTSNVLSYTLYHNCGATTFKGGGTLSLTNTAENANYNFENSEGDVTIKDGTQITTSGGSSHIAGNLTITDSNSKLAIDSGTDLNIGITDFHTINPDASTVTVENGGILENNGTLKMWQREVTNHGIYGDILGSGGIVFPTNSPTDPPTVYCLVDDEFISYGGDISESGLDLSTSLPTVVTRYKAGDGYALFIPAEGGVNAKLEFHDATIATTDATALNLPSTEAVDITVSGDNFLTAGGNGNVIATNGRALSVTGSGNLSLAGSYYGVNVNGDGAVSISIDGNLTVDTRFQPMSTSGDITVSAKSITSKSGYSFYSGGMVSLSATDGDIVFDDTGKTDKQQKIVGTNGITLNAPNGKITITDGGSGTYAIKSTSGAITMTALNDVIINASSNGGIDSGKTDISDVISVNSTNGSILMNCGDFYECVQASGGVALAAAKDITLNGTENSTAAIQATGQTVSITAGGKLSSATAWGFQVGTLTIKTDEVSIAGTSQGGVEANAVSITNTDGTNNCKSVSITATSGSASWAAINSPNVTIKADDVMICGNNSAKAINTPNDQGKVTIGDAGMIIGTVSISGASNINANILKIEGTGADASSGLDLSTPPSVITYYKAGNGYALFTPANGETKATLTLHSASITSGSVTPLKLGVETVIRLEGTNSLENSKTDGGVGIMARSSAGVLQPMTIHGGSDDSLTISAWQCTRMGALTIDGGSITMDGTVNGILTEGNVVLKNGAKVSASGGDMGGAIQLEDPSETEKYSLTVMEGSTLTVNESDAFITGDLTISGSGSKVTINSGATAMVLGVIENSGVLENNGIWQMKLGTTVDEIKALKLTGNGVVRVFTNEPSPFTPPAWDTYTNEGVKVNEISGDLDLTIGDHSGATVAADGYEWNDGTNTLTLGNVVVTGGLTVPDNATITTSTNSVIGGSISPKGDAPCELTFNGNGSLTVNGSIGNAQGGTMTVSDGADVIVNGSVNIGTSGGADGTLNVTGSGTTLAVSSSLGYAVLFETVNVLNGGNLTARAEGEGSVGVQTLSGGVHVKGGSTLSTGCDYGVYIIGGELEVDSTSKLATKGSVAPFCVVDKTFDGQQDDVVNLPGIPSGTEIKSTEGTKGKYWSLVSTNGTLSVFNEDNDVVTLIGAITGELTFQKAAKKHSSDSSGGGVSLTRTLTFKTNGGSEISSVSKTSGTVVDLKDYKTTRDGYTFAGWYSDESLTKKIASVTLSASTTVYAKWTESEEKIEETNESKNPFDDVKDSDYYYDAVQWAVEKEITSGTTGNSFSPNLICTRAQMVAFLWRAMGCQEPITDTCPFTDVSKDAYYYKAVLWAMENGVTSGTTATTFSPNATVTRGQTVTFLWRAAGKPTSGAANPYTDVAERDYEYDAILWATKEGITQGTSATTFSPDTPCTRAQIVTFLYRYTNR